MEQNTPSTTITLTEEEMTIILHALTHHEVAYMREYKTSQNSFWTQKADAVFRVYQKLLRA